jgi:2-hydroxychromene-2-carboxylate isomerase
MMSEPSAPPAAMPSGARIDWYFDFISPFAYLQWQRLRREAPSLVIAAHPVLFAGLLKRWDNKGPVEIPPKRGWTYAHCLWIAHRHQIPMRLPSRHPFNPLPLLRLSIALNNSSDVVDRLFRFVWQDAHLPDESEHWAMLLQELDIREEVLSSDAVKSTLVANGETAVAAGVFGVPTAVVDGQCFWGVDATDMLFAYLRGDPFFSSADWQRAHSLPEGQQRR